MIPPSKTRQILEIARIEEVISDFLTLRRAGANLTALCPFHHEKTPSFSVSPIRNTFKCFGCGKGGNAAKFLMEHEGYSFPEALRWLARKYNIEIEETQPSPEQLATQQAEESLFIVNDFAQKFFQSHLPGAGLDYLKTRGFTEATIQKFGLGYAPDSWDALTKAATQAGFKLEQLQKLGLTTPSGKDFFRNRVIFPIHNLSSKPIAFAGRIFSSANGGLLPKYLNSQESPIYYKSQTLYGIYLARKSIRQQDECILVEGYTDLVALHQAGIENVVASAGTALTAEQLLLIRRFTQNLHILYDGDPAGIAAAMRGIDLALELDLNLKVTPLPHPEDPDSFLRKIGSAAFTEYLTTHSKDFIAFKANHLLAAADNDPVKKAAIVHSIVDSIARIADPIKRSFFIKDCALLVGLSENILTAESNKAVQTLAKKGNSSLGPVPNNDVGTSSLTPRTSSLNIERHLTYLLLEHGAEIFDTKGKITVAEHILAHIEKELERFDDLHCQHICQESIQLVLDKQPVTQQYFMAHEDPGIRELSMDLISSAQLPDCQGPSPEWDERFMSDDKQATPFKEISHAIIRLKLDKNTGQSERNRQQLEQAQLNGDRGLVLQLLKTQSELDTARNALTEQLSKMAGV